MIYMNDIKYTDLYRADCKIQHCTWFDFSRSLQVKEAKWGQMKAHNYMTSYP